MCFKREELEMSNNFKEEVLSRRTFAIISHPDAGKTTLTEKLLLFGGAIRDAGTVKAKKLVSLRQVTGWKLKSNGESPLHPALCNLTIMIFESTFWIHLGTRTSVKILTEP